MYWNENRKPAYLLLADGSIYEGVSIGKEGTAVGEAVFATAMVGYQELLTDPSYFGQLVIQTFPLIGNYGVNSEDLESERCYLSGYIVREWCEIPSNFRCEGNVDEYLRAEYRRHCRCRYQEPDQKNPRSRCDERGDHH